MYQSFFGLREAPFSIAPDPRYLFLSGSHQEALAHLRFGLAGGGGFVLLTGEVGTGKTTMCRCLLEQIPEECDVAYIVNPKLTVAELLSTICSEFGIAYPAGNESIKVFIDCINEHLLAAHAKGRHTVLIIDEAQNLAPEVLEQMRLLTNVETNKRKLLQIILLGQPELEQMLARQDLRQLAQRIVARYSLRPLGKAEVAAYVRHRLEVSGGRQRIIPARLMGTLYRLSGGIPRVVNILCDRALLGAYAQGKDEIDRRMLIHAGREICGRPRRRTLAALVAGTAAITAAAAFALYRQEASAPAAPTAASGLLPGAAAKPRPALPDQLLPPAGADDAMAYAALLRAWEVAYTGGDACAAAHQAGLRCQAARGSLDELRRLNRPALLQLRDTAGKPFWACLVGLEQDSARFAMGANAVAVALSALASQWSGHYVVLSRVPPGLPPLIQPGMRGPAAEWIGRQLSRLAGKAGAAPMPSMTESEPVFDEAMLRRVKEFQLARGLIPDGTVGERTLMHLASAGDREGPTLMRNAGEAQ